MNNIMISKKEALNVSSFWGKLKVGAIAIVMLGLFSPLLLAQEELSLSKAIADGLENNYDLIMIHNDSKIAGINNTWGNTSLMPSLSFTASASENFNYNDDDNYRAQTVSPEVNLRWTIFNGFSARISKSRYEDLEAQSQGNTAILVESTIQDIILAYNNCLLQEKLMTVYEDLSHLSKDRYQRAEDSKAIGASTTYESLQAKTSWLEDQSNFLQQKVNYENAIRTLNFAMGLEGDPKWDFTTELSAIANDYNLEDMSKKLKSNNKTLQNQYIYQSLLAKETQAARSSYLPTLALNSGVNNTDYSLTHKGTSTDVDQNSYNAYVGLSLSWSIFNGGTRKRSVSIAKINEETAVVQIDQMEHSLDNQLLQMYSTYNVNKALLSLANEKEAAARLNLELSKEKLQNGSINSFNYRDVQLAYMNAAISQLTASYNLILSNTNLLRITGGIVDEYGM